MRQDDHGFEASYLKIHCETLSEVCVWGKPARCPCRGSEFLPYLEFWSWLSLCEVRSRQSEWQEMKDGSCPFQELLGLEAEAVSFSTTLPPSPGFSTGSAKAPGSVGFASFLFKGNVF